MLESMNHFESKQICLDGLDVTKHDSHLDAFREKGWVVFRSSPDLNGMNFRYSLKRPVRRAKKTPHQK